MENVSSKSRTATRTRRAAAASRSMREGTCSMRERRREALGKKKHSGGAEHSGGGTRIAAEAERVEGAREAEGCEDSGYQTGGHSGRLLGMINSSMSIHCSNRQDLTETAKVRDSTWVQKTFVPSAFNAD